MRRNRDRSGSRSPSRDRDRKRRGKDDSDSDGERRSRRRSREGSHSDSDRENRRGGGKKESKRSRSKSPSQGKGVESKKGADEKEGETLTEFEKAKRAAVEKAKQMAAQAAANRQPGALTAAPMPSSLMPNPQEQKRKLLWASKKKEEPAAATPSTFNQWENVQIGDQQTTEKFRKLMGLGKKGGPTAAPQAPAKPGASAHAAAQVDLIEIERQFEESRRRQYSHGGGSLGLGL